MYYRALVMKAMGIERRITCARYLRDKNLIEIHITETDTSLHTTSETNLYPIYIAPFENMNKERLLIRIRSKLDGNEDANIDQIVNSLINTRIGKQRKTVKS